MGWKGLAIGGYLGALFGGPLGVILGALLGHKAENLAFGKKNRPRYASMPPGERSKVFCASAAAMFAKMAKVDGAVTMDEISGVETAFRRLGFSPAARRYAVSVFRRAKNDSHSIFEYAVDFAHAVDSTEVRELLYEILWDLACADGEVTRAELAVLQRIPRALKIPSEWYAYFAAQRLGAGRRGNRQSGGDSLSSAYALLGASAADDAETLKRKYRELAKKNHPDALRAQGLPEEMVGKATERMSRINAAWTAIKEARGM